MKQQKQEQLLALVGFLLLGPDAAMQVLEYHLAEEDIDHAFEVYIQ
jgi:hypothetical protein